jgi:hypothetical protein
MSVRPAASHIRVPEGKPIMPSPEVPSGRCATGRIDAASQHHAGTANLDLDDALLDNRSVPARRSG